MSIVILSSTELKKSFQKSFRNTISGSLDPNQANFRPNLNPNCFATRAGLSTSVEFYLNFLKTKPS